MSKAYVVKTIYFENGTRRSYPGIHESLLGGKARIGWSSRDDHDLRLLTDKIDRGESGELRPDQQDAAKCRGFLNRVKGGDYLVYPQQPKANHLLIAQVQDGPNGDYGFSPSEEALDGDFRSFRGCVLLTPHPVPYSDRVLRPYVQSRLGLRGRFYELTNPDTLQFTLEGLDQIPKLPPEPKRSIAVRLSRIRDLIGPGLPKLIQQEFLRQDLSWFCSELFKQQGYYVRYQEGAGEYGSDLIVEIRSELLPRSLRVGVQVKAYTDTVSLQTFRADIQPLIDGWTKNALDFGVLLTTGFCDQACLEHLEEHNASHADRQIVLIDGSKFGSLLIKALGGFGSDDE